MTIDDTVKQESEKPPEDCMNQFMGEKENALVDMPEKYDIKCGFLIEYNRSLLLTEKEWGMILQPAGCGGPFLCLKDSAKYTSAGNLA